jgi:5-methylcytosine-specific restriction endonuclease McrA
MNTTFAHRRCLVLNKSWNPIGTVSLERAITLLFTVVQNGEPKARIIDPSSYQTFTWEDWSKLRPSATDEKIIGANLHFRVPEIILLSKYDKMPQRQAHFSRRNLFKRDGQTCQYCGDQPGSEELTIDHVLPRSQGGVTSWENCVLACVTCNRKKANRTPSQAKMKLMKVPKKPHLKALKFDTLKPVKSWCAFLGAAYWSIGLENDMGQ